MLKLRELVGSLYLIYGITKVTVGLGLLVLPQQVIDNMPIINEIGVHRDPTLAGKVYECAYLLFGIYTILVALSLLHIFEPSWRRYFEQRETQYAIVFALGAIMVVFYALVLYTDVPISKIPENRNYYLLLGLGGGLSFMLLPAIWEATMYFNPWFGNLRFEQKSMVAIGLVLAVLITADGIYTYLQKNKLDSIILPDALRSEIDKLHNYASLSTITWSSS
jgi:hypothetical protein